MQVAYFFTMSAHIANEKLENDIVEKCLFMVKKKTTLYTFSYCECHVL